MFREYNAGQNHDIKKGNKSFGRFEQSTYLEKPSNIKIPFTKQ